MAQSLQGRHSKTIEMPEWHSCFDGTRRKTSEMATWLVILPDDAVKQLKFQHGAVNCTVLSTEDKEMQVKLLHGTVILMDDAVNQLKSLHCAVILMEDKEKHSKIPTWHSHFDGRRSKPI